MAWDRLGEARADLISVCNGASLGDELGYFSGASKLIWSGEPLWEKRGEETGGGEGGV